MAANLEGLKERWERMNSRERGLLSLLALALAIGIVASVVAKVRGDMASIEAKNEDSRKALRMLSLYRVAKARAVGQGSTVVVPKTAIDLDSYVEKIAKELELTSPTYPAPRQETKGNVTELSFEVKFKGLNIDQLGQLLEKLETGSKVVVIKEMNVDTSFRDKEKLEVSMTIATYQKKAIEKEGDDDKEDA